MSLLFVHLSDIHFGQERESGAVVVNDDVKEQLILDARDYVLTLGKKKADGVIVSGDTAYAGKEHEYNSAGHWLDRLTNAVGCEIPSVQVVPGNHDIDRDAISPITQTIIDEIIEKGDSSLDKYLENENDREFLFNQFGAYRTFAEGYNCPLDSVGIIKNHRVFDLAPDRKLKFLGVNTALICSKSKKEDGGLLLGKRQRVIPMEIGLETVVIAHHPLNWLQDSEDAEKYIRNRARVFISGHEHNPSHRCEEIDINSDLLTIASGATVPPDVSELYNYCYNILEFDYNADGDALKVTVHCRAWNDDLKKFDGDKKNFDSAIKSYILKCPNFKKLGYQPAPKEHVEVHENVTSHYSNMLESTIENEILEEKEFQLVLLRFFRDLSVSQRLSILIEMGALPENWNKAPNHALERMGFNKLIRRGMLDQLHERINQLLQDK